MSSTNTTTPSMMNASKTAAPKRVAKKSDAPVAASASTTVAAPVAPVVATPVASEAKKTVKRAAKTETAPVTASASASASTAPVVASASPSSDAVVDSPVAVEDTWQTDLKSVQSQLLAVREATTAALTALKGLDRRFTRELKEARKNRRKVRKELAEGEKAAPSEFEKPRPISDELGLFLGLGKNAQISRAEVTRSISNYVKSNGLGNGQKIAHNAALRTLMGISETDELTIFNMQKYLNRHYLKLAPAVPVAPKA